ncbi:unnamed protein product [Diatraea saccharalis]|uniref:Tetratricopeptide repeat protein 36 n=1 Tax=Diatraea saccharalis TaxID=40085 RepID=A0A9N9QZ71_9NEOP|nr:unnamed protein product [Diatraea saccharalis]
MAALEHLSERDKAVLRSIFDPTATIGDVVDDGDTFEEELDETTDLDKQASALCSQGVRLAETGKQEEALVLLSQGIELAPGRPAAYNDRAQLLRLMQRDDGR